MFSLYTFLTGALRMYGSYTNREGSASGCFFVAKDMFWTSVKYVLDSVIVSLSAPPHWHFRSPDLTF